MNPALRWPLYPVYRSLNCTPSPAPGDAAAFAAFAADVLVLTMTLDVKAHRQICQRRLLGKLTVCEVNDYLPDVQPSNPAHRIWADTRGVHLFEQLIARSDAVRDGVTGFLFDTPEQLLGILDGLAGAPELRQCVARAAHAYLHSQRRIE